MMSREALKFIESKRGYLRARRRSVERGETMDEGTIRVTKLEVKRQPSDRWSWVFWQ
jgi:hypothetical protein